MPRSLPFWLGLLVVVGAALAWWLLHPESPTSNDVTRDDVRDTAPTTPPSAPPPPAREGAAAAEDPPTAQPAPTPNPPDATPWPLPPERLEIERIAYTDVSLSDVLYDLGAKTGLAVRISEAARAQVEQARVTLALENTTGALVLGTALRPFDLDYTVREGVLYVFVDDE